MMVVVSAGCKKASMVLDCEALVKTVAVAILLRTADCELLAAL